MELYSIADEMRKTIHHWLSAPDPSSNYNDACKKRQPTTGAWFIDGEKFKLWKSGLNSFIWLHGIRMFPSFHVHFVMMSDVMIAGSGKSVLWHVVPDMISEIGANYSCQFNHH
jgi:hypothetical protein